MRHDHKESDVKNSGRDAPEALGKISRLVADNTDLGLPLGANGGGVDIVVSPLETRQICDDELNVFMYFRLLSRPRFILSQLVLFILEPEGTKLVSPPPITFLDLNVSADSTTRFSSKEL
ncbi:unnamed protein product [Microthlaspi erraticum]|uniref:Uncharacterized protein n=1 Tax=Microthlaspi erraticum TaxID=1685480 RepID=A0A6D2KJL9_9BRAS|nr:unnamed protein product [Microthlaspi erraticum]